MEINNLELLGLNKYEGSIYIALLKHPSSSASEISKYSLVPQNRVYDIVEQLISKKFVYLIPENPKRYTPENPKIIREKIRVKQKEIEKLDSEFENLEEEYRVINTQRVILSRGKKNFDSIFKSIPDSKKFSYSIQPKLSILPQHLKAANEHRKKGVKQLSFADTTMKDSSNLKKWKTIQPNYKLIDTRDIAIHINESGVLISLIPPKHESTILYIENTDLGHLMKEMFESYYNKTK
jgi:sugar-specific transcriptional regulator TrmB